MTSFVPLKPQLRTSAFRGNLEKAIQDELCLLRTILDSQQADGKDIDTAVASHGATISSALYSIRYGNIIVATEDLNRCTVLIGEVWYNH